MFSKCGSRAFISCRSSSILPANANVKLDALPCHRRGFLHFGDLLGLQALPALNHLVDHPGTLVEGPEPGALYAGVVDEDVLASVVGGDETVALLLAEPPKPFLGPYVGARPSFPGAPHQQKCRPLVWAAPPSKQNPPLLFLNHTIAASSYPTAVCFHTEPPSRSACG